MKERNKSLASFNDSEQVATKRMRTESKMAGIIIRKKRQIEEDALFKNLRLKLYIRGARCMIKVETKS